jgi:hypothetical protein
VLKVVSVFTVLDHTSEFLSKPVKDDEHVDGWNKIVTCLLNSTASSAEFLSTLETSYSQNINLSKKALNLFSGLTGDTQTQNKYNQLILKCINEENDVFSNELSGRLKSSKWEQYSENDFLVNLGKKLNYNVKTISDKDKDDILARAIAHLKENEGAYDEENKASRVVMFLFDKLSDSDFKTLAKAYLSIYCDDFRKSSYNQKKTAKLVFDHIGLQKAITIVWPEIVEKLRVAKEDYYIFDDKKDSLKNKERAVQNIYGKFANLFDDDKSIKNKLDEEYDKL